MAILNESTEEIGFQVTEASSRDLGKAYVRIEPAAMMSLQVRVGDVVEVRGKGRAVGKAMPCAKELRGQSRVQIDGILRSGAQCSLGDIVQISKVDAKEGVSVVLRPRNIRPIERDLDYIAKLIDGLPVQKGGCIRATLFGNESIDFDVLSVDPEGVVVISPMTKLTIAACEAEGQHKALSYEEIGGAKNQLQRIRELIELPLRYPELFERLGIEPPRGVLLYGPPGCGKTLIARAIAQESEANFFVVSGPEIIHKHYGESEAHLRRIFEEAAKKGPSIIFLDEIDAIAPRRENAAGDVERRVVAQLLTLMDGLKRRENVVVIAATNLPNSIDPALRRPGRFDREIEITVPDRSERQHILEIHSRGMPLHGDVDLAQLASITHGYVGADLAALCREAAMACLREVFQDQGWNPSKVPYSRLAALQVSMYHFQEAFQSIEPSAIREVFVEVPVVRWEDIGGHDDVKQVIREEITWPILYADLFNELKLKPSRGLLLAGPPGVGKTMIAKAAATECQVNFISIKGPELVSKYVGDSEKAIRDIFSKARQAAPCLMFFDEIDSLFPTRGSSDHDSGVSSRILGQFLAEMDGIEELTEYLSWLQRIDLRSLIQPSADSVGSRKPLTSNCPMP